jgi:hypothetical protein
MTEQFLLYLREQDVFTQSGADPLFTWQIVTEWNSQWLMMVSGGQSNGDGWMIFSFPSAWLNHKYLKLQWMSQSQNGTNGHFLVLVYDGLYDVSNDSDWKLPNSNPNPYPWIVTKGNGKIQTLMDAHGDHFTPQTLNAQFNFNASQSYVTIFVGFRDNWQGGNAMAMHLHNVQILDSDNATVLYQNPTNRTPVMQRTGTLNDYGYCGWLTHSVSKSVDVMFSEKIKGTYGIDVLLVPQNQNVQIGDLWFNYIIEFEIVNRQLTQIPEWVNQVEELRTEFYEVHLKQVTYTIRMTDKEKWQVECAMRSHKMLQLIDTIHSIDANAWITKVESKMFFQNVTKPWEVKVTLSYVRKIGAN